MSDVSLVATPALVLLLIWMLLYPLGHVFSFAFQGLCCLVVVYRHLPEVFLKVLDVLQG